MSTRTLQERCANMKRLFPAIPDAAMAKMLADHWLALETARRLEERIACAPRAPSIRRYETDDALAHRS